MKVLDKKTREEIQGCYDAYIGSKDRKAALTTEMAESVEVAAALLDVSKKDAKKLFKYMELFPLESEYNILHLCEEVKKED